MQSRQNTATDRLIDEPLRRRYASDLLVGGLPDVSRALAAAGVLASEGCAPGLGNTLGYLRTLATLGLVNATAARAAEPHLDARAILSEAGLGAVIDDIGADHTSTWGVYAAQAPGFQLQATRTGHGWTLTGTKPWCSLADRVTHAVITVDVSGEGQRAFAVRLDPELVTVPSTPWVARGLAAVPSGPIAMDALPAVPVGPPGWYLDRPGFAWGAVGVAAVWYGIALGLVQAVRRHAAAHGEDRILLSQLGSADEVLFAAAMCLDGAARAIDAGVRGHEGQVMAQRVRAVTARAAESVIQIAGHALGPGPLVSDESHARRVADLTVYLRQHHGERDLAYLGQLLLGEVGDDDA